MYVYAGYHNFFKPYRIKQRDLRSHAAVAGYDTGKIASCVKRLFTTRFYFSGAAFLSPACLR